VTQAVLDAAPASAAARKSADVSAALTFIARSDAKPVFHSAAYTGGAPQVFFDTERHTVLIRDMRPLEGALSLEREGFELLRDRTAVRDLYDDDALERVYYPEIEALLREVTGASRVVVFDATRRSDGDAGARNRDGMRGPASRVHVDYTERCTWTTPRGARGLHREVHVDYTEKSGPQRVKDLLGEAEAGRLAASGARIIQINVWRPIRGPVQGSPLALEGLDQARRDQVDQRLPRWAHFASY
jgi:hypothetical protein